MTNDDRRLLQPYIRQSRAVNGESEDSSLSLSQQEDSIKAWGERAGFHVLRAIRDHDETGRTMNRVAIPQHRRFGSPSPIVGITRTRRRCRR